MGVLEFCWFWFRIGDLAVIKLAYGGSALSGLAARKLELKEVGSEGVSLAHV